MLKLFFLTIGAFSRVSGACVKVADSHCKNRVRLVGFCSYGGREQSPKNVLPLAMLFRREMHILPEPPKQYGPALTQSRWQLFIR